MTRRDQLLSMRMQELTKVASRLGIKINPKASKAVAVDKIIEAENNPDSTPTEVKEESKLVPMPGAEKLEELKKEYSKEPGRKPRITITYNGENKTPGEWGKEFNMDPKKIRLALRKGKSPEEIFNGKNK